MANLSIGYLEPDQVSFWDAFVDRSPEACLLYTSDAADEGEA